MNNNLNNLTCAKCGRQIGATDRFCTNCGSPVNGNSPQQIIKPNEKVFIKASNFDYIYSYDDDMFLETIISRELNKLEIDKNANLVPEDVLKRKKILCIIFAVLLFVYVSLFFFHFPIFTYIVGLIILIIFKKITNKFNLITYLKKEIQSRPSEKISNILMNVKNSFVVDNLKSLRLWSILIALVLPMIIFCEPRILYEHVDGGYAVRYYAFGITNFKTATIPDTHNGEPVVGLRGNTFSNMPFLTTVSLPDSITEIRGQAFKNCYSLKSVNMPSNLTYLGGGAFYHATSIKSIELPDTLTYLGGEAFYGAKSLMYVKLSKNLSEIRGDTFEYCTSLQSISIPDKVTRIGGHAFYGATALSEVTFTRNSQLLEIGSSAFRKCPNLYSITVSRHTFINDRAFKESPTTVYYFD